MMKSMKDGRTTLIDDTRWLDDDEMAAWRAYAETVFDLNAALEADLSAVGLTLGDYQVLVYPSESPDRTMRMVDLAGRLQLSPSGVTRRLDGLVKGGLVERAPGATDRRVMLAILTDAGKAELDAAYPVHLASVRRRLIDRVTPDDVDALERIFRRVQAGLRRAEPIDNAAAP